MAQPDITIYTYFRSSCSARLRIALNIKGLKYQQKFIHLVKGEQSSSEYLSINPSGMVPTIIFTYPENEETFTLTQSLAILEYLDETFPSPEYPSLLPKTPKERARVRQLSNIIACDVQPVTNMKILNHIKNLSKEAGKDRDTAGQQWQVSRMTEGLKAYEELVKYYAGKYSFGDNVTMADCCLKPAIDGAIRFGVDLNVMPTISKIKQNLEDLDAVKKASWRMQGDTPEEFRPK